MNTLECRTRGKNTPKESPGNNKAVAVLLVVTGVAVATTLGFCGKKDDLMETVSAPLVDNQPSGVVQQPESLRQMPSVTLAASENAFDVPAGVDMEKEEYKEAAKKVIIYARDLVGTELIPALNSGGDQVQAFREYVEKVQAEAMKVSEFASFIGDLSVHTDKESYLLVADKLKRLLIGSDVYFDMAHTAVPFNGGIGMKPQLDFFHISKWETVTIQDGGKYFDLPVMTAGKPYAADAEGGSVAEYDYEIGAAFFRAPHAGKNMAEGIQNMKDLNLLPQNYPHHLLGQFYQEYIRDTKIHEATHGFLHQVFPKYGSETSADVGFSVRLDVPFAPGQVANLGSVYSPVNFSELCAVGNELHHTQAKINYSLLQYLSKGSSTADSGLGYELVGKLLPLYTLLEAPDSPQKTVLIELIAQKQPVSTMHFVRFANTLPLETVHKIGARLYQAGYDLFEQAESGQLRLLKRR